MEIKDIKRIRKKLGLTQSDLAAHSGVSQSLIAKIEAGNIDPAYSNAKKIFDTLDTISEKNELKAKDITHQQIISLSPDADVKTAIMLMKKHNISQIPIIDDNKSIGLVSESNILHAVMNRKKMNLSAIMQDSPPVVAETTSAEAVSKLLTFFPMVLVSRSGKLRGVITKYDIIERLY